MRESLQRAILREAPLRPAVRVALLLAFVWFLSAPFLSHLHKAFNADRPHGDWYSIYSIAEYSLRTGELEADEASEEVRTQRYPPIARPMLMLFAVLPKPLAATVSFVLFAGLYLWCAVRISGLFLAPTGAGRWIAAALVWMIVGPYIWADLTAGNLTSILLASVTGTYFLARAGRPLAAGIVLSIGIMLKIIPVLCLLHFLVRRQWRVGVGAAVGIVALGLLPSLAIFGPRKLIDYHEYWYRTQYSQYTPMKTIESGVECSYQNQAVVRMLVRLLSRTNAGRTADPFYVSIAEPPRIVIKALYVFIMTASGLAMAWTVWRLRSAPAFGSLTSYALCVGSMLWFSPWVASYYFSLAMWPAAAVMAMWLGSPDAAVDRGESRTTRVAAVALAIWILAMPALASYFLRALGIHTLAAALLLVVLGARDRLPR